MEETINSLKKLIINESPLLFLGAGFSFGARTFKGADLPSGDKLKRIILCEFLKISDTTSEYKELIHSPLSQVCQYSEHEKSKTHLADFLTDYFKNIRPASYHKKLSLYNWRKIYSTNIDDLVETIYREADKDLLVQNLSRKVMIKKDNITEFIKLHGCVNNPSEGFVFSTDQYVDSIINSRDYRFSSLSLDMHSENFIFIGSSFDEINIDYYLKLYENSGYESSRGRLFFINPNPSLIFSSKIQHSNGKIVKWTNEQFLEFLSSLINEISTLHTQSEKNLSIYGYHSFKEIKSKINHTESYNSRLYFGYEPKWEDILMDWDFTNHQVIAEFDNFIKSMESENAGVFSIMGKAYTGKSTCLYRLGVELDKSGYEVFEFRSRTMDIYNFLQYIKKTKNKDKFALLIDNASYYYGLLKHLIRKLPKNKKLIILTSSRPIHHYRKRYIFIGMNFHEVEINELLNKEYAINIINKLEEKGYSGEIKKKKDKGDQIQYVLDQKNLMTTLYRLTLGKGFTDRFSRDIKPLLNVNSSSKEMLINLAMFDRLEIPYFPIELMTLIYKNEKEEILKNIDDYIKISNKNNVQLRSVFFVNRILQSTNKRQLINQVKEILIYISPQVEDFEHTYWNEIQISLMKEKFLRNLLDIPSNLIKNCLYEIGSYYSHSFNYWIQLGIAEQRENEYEKALNHFKQAEALNPKSYMVQNAIGRNFMKLANYLNSYPLSKSYLEEGEKILLKLILEREEFEARAFSTHSYLYEKVTFLKKYKIELSNSELKKLFHYLELIIQKDPRDVMAKSISNFFYKYLQSINKSNLFKINYYDLENFKTIFQPYRHVNIDSLLDDIFE